MKMAEDISLFSSETFDSIKQRRSVKIFDSFHKISDKEIEKILSLTILSPTSYNI
jgi:nitroreductase